MQVKRGRKKGHKSKDRHRCEDEWTSVVAGSAPSSELHPSRVLVSIQSNPILVRARGAPGLGFVRTQVFSRSHLSQLTEDILRILQMLNRENYPSS